MILSTTCQYTIRGWQLLGIFLLVIKIVIPLIIIITSVIPLFGALMKGNVDSTIKAWILIFKKIVAGVIIFLIPGLIVSGVKFLVGVEPGSDTARCTTCVSEPYSTNCVKYVKDLDTIERGGYVDLSKDDNGLSMEGSIDSEELEDASGVLTPSGLGGHSITTKTSYGDSVLNVEKAIETNYNNPSSGLGDGRNLYRAVQAAVYTGEYVVYSQNRNYGSVDASSSGGRICWSNMETGELVKCVEVGSEGGHMEGLAYDCDRGLILKKADGKLMLFNNNTMEFVGYSSIPSVADMTYVPNIHMLVTCSGGAFNFYSYNSDNNTYVFDHSVTLQNYDVAAVQGIGTDGTNIFIADSAPGTSKRNLYTYSLDGQRLEVHSFGSGFGSLSDEVESAFGDNNGNLYLACPQGIARVLNYSANIVGL